MRQPSFCALAALLLVSAPLNAQANPPGGMVHTVGMQHTPGMGHSPGVQQPVQGGQAVRRLVGAHAPMLEAVGGWRATTTAAPTRTALSRCWHTH